MDTHKLHSNGQISIFSDATHIYGTSTLFWDNTNNRLGIGTATPSQKLSVAGIIESTTGGFKFPDGSTQVSAGVKYTDSRFSTVSFSRNMSAGDGNQSIIGAGFTPKGVIIFSNIDNSDQQIFGMAVSDEGHSVFRSTPASYAGKTSALIFYNSTGGTYVARLVSFDSDGMTISWTKTSSPTGTTINSVALFFR